MTRTAVLDLEMTDRYQSQGYVVLDRLLRPDRLTALRQHFEQKLASLPAGERPENMDVPHFTDPQLFSWLLDDEVLDIVETIIGPDIALFSSHFFCKPAGDGKSVPWHQDAYFWRDTITPATEAMTIWLALDPSTTQNGCMQVIPGSHRAEADRYRDVTDPGSVFDEELDPGQVDASQAVPVELAPGQASVHAASLVHGSTANHSPQRRCGFTMRYMPTTVRFNPALSHRHQVYLARGRDRAGNAYADPARSYPELVRAEQAYLGERPAHGTR